ncbi:hypothetical protein CK203_080919 [Vitis vinifera]|uniref:DUF4218 domain-containing protein n=1 Tax=Vitis vinifera TaxID=29760 RepID=A0A438C096_VITVI|nr:hypothetical protein CK203_080919 [Vitis vinifera]
MFQSSKIAKDLIWHAQGGEFDGKMRHPSDSPSWKVIDHRWPDFSAEPRNLRLAISTDGINPHSSLAADIYLAPLIEDLKTLWETGVEAYDAYQRESKGYFACPICGSETYSHRKDKRWTQLSPRPYGHGLRCELAPRFESNRTYLPPACYTLSRKEKKVFCQTLAELKVPEGYCSNFRNLVSMEDLKLYGLKSHDYHTLMQQLLPVALRSLLPKHVRHAIARLSLFFNALCKKVVDVSTLDKLQNELVVTLCLLEKYFPPSFFDIMIHLTVHLVRERKLLNFVQSTYQMWMQLEFLVALMLTIKLGRLFLESYPEVDCTLLLQAHHYVLENTTIIQPYIEEHMKWLKLNNPRQSKRQKWLQEEHMRTFTHWLRKKVFKCNWVDNKSGVKVDEFGLTLVDFTKMAHKSDPFILASQAKQVFYVQDQLDPRWSVVLSTPERDFSFSAKDSDDFMDNSIEHHPLITTLAQVESF